MKAIRAIRSLPEGAVYDEMDSPVGKLTIVISIKGLHAILWDNDRMNPLCERIMSGLIQSKNEQTPLCQRQ